MILKVRVVQRCLFWLAGLCLFPAQAGAAETSQLNLKQYQVRVADHSALGAVPNLEIVRNGQLMFRLPLVSAFDSASDHEHLSNIRYQVVTDPAALPAVRYQIKASALSNLWTQREFTWNLYNDHLEYAQALWGTGHPGRSYFFSNGRPGRWDQGSSDGAAWNATLMTDHYWSPSPNHANQFEFSIAEPQTLGFGNPERSGSEDDFRPAQMGDLFAPPPLMLAFHRNGQWASVGIGTQPGRYLFPALDYSGSRYTGAAWWVDYLGYQTVEAGQRFDAPVVALHFGHSAKATLRSYTAWLNTNGFATKAQFPDVAWHHLPLFCGWAEQTSQAIPFGRAPNAEATQKNYETWLAELAQRKLPVGTVVIDDKWQKGYGSFDVDTDKWPDLKGFVARQHALGRHVLLWVPVAHVDGLPAALCINDADQQCLAPDLANPEYEIYLRAQIRTLVEGIGIDGFKEDWVWAPNRPGLPVPPQLAGLEAVRHFQEILYSETHRWHPDALVETQTPNAAFRNSSDVLRLNDVWFATRNIVQTMRERADIAHMSGWDLVDTDNAGSTTLDTWRDYMKVQPAIGIPALYFVHRTESTGEQPDAADWVAMAKLWNRYIKTLPATTK